MTGRRLSAAVAGLVALLTPWALREHAQLTPETFAAPLLIAAALAAAEERRSWAGGLLGSIAALFKLAFLLPAVAIAAVAATPATALGTLIVAMAVELGAAWAGFGAAFWRGAVEAQTQTGLSPLHYAGGLWAQAAWNLVPLLVPAALAIWLRMRGRGDAPAGRADPRAARLFRAVLAGAVASLVLLLTLLKRGSYLNAVVVVEPPLLILAACGVTWALERRTWAMHRELAALDRTRRPRAGARRRRSGLTARLTARSGRVHPPARGVGARLEAHRRSGCAGRWRSIDRCPPDAAYPGPPYLAFAGRSPNARQPARPVHHRARPRRRAIPGGGGRRSATVSVRLGPGGRRGPQKAAERRSVSR